MNQRRNKTLWILIIIIIIFRGSVLEVFNSFWKFVWYDIFRRREKTFWYDLYYSTNTVHLIRCQFCELDFTLQGSSWVLFSITQTTFACVNSFKNMPLYICASKPSLNGITETFRHLFHMYTFILNFSFLQHRFNKKPEKTNISHLLLSSILVKEISFRYKRVKIPYLVNELQYFIGMEFFTSFSSLF